MQSNGMISSRNLNLGRWSAMLLFVMIGAAVVVEGGDGGGAGIASPAMPSMGMDGMGITGMLQASLAAAGVQMPPELMEETRRLVSGGASATRQHGDDGSRDERIADTKPSLKAAGDARDPRSLQKWGRVSLRDDNRLTQDEKEYVVQTAVNRSVIVGSAGSIASFRAAVTAYNSTYLDDPYAAVFARQVCPDKLAEALTKPPEALARFAVRTRHFDELVRDAIHSREIDQVVMIAAGFDARAMRGRDMRFHEVPAERAAPYVPRGGKKFFDDKQRRLAFYEIDLPELIEAKRDLLQAVEGDIEQQQQGAKDLTENAPEVIRVGVDMVQDDWVQVLRMAGFNPERPACFVLEGFLYYFDEVTVRRTMAALSEIAVEGSRIGASAVSRAISDNSSRFVWGTDEPEAFFAEYGWESVHAGQYGDPSIARGWPMGQDEQQRAAKPRSDRSVKRTWYVVGTKGRGKVTRREAMVERLCRLVDRVRPIFERVSPWVMKIATGGLKIAIPLPHWAKDFVG